MVLHAAAALAVAISPETHTKHWCTIYCILYTFHNNSLAKVSRPSGCASLCIAVGAIIIGDEILKPNTVVDISILLTSTRILE